MENIYLSYNVASSSGLAGLSQLIALFHPVLIFLQEVTVTTEQLLAQVGDQFDGLCNVDESESDFI